jgi:Domain of unknown function (DUF4190)
VSDDLPPVAGLRRRVPPPPPPGSRAPRIGVFVGPASEGGFVPAQGQYRPLPEHPVAGRNTFAVTALVLGVLWLGGVGSLLAVIFGHLALGQIAASQGWQEGRGLAIAGLLLGYLGLALAVVSLVSGAAGS